MYGKAFITIILVAGLSFTSAGCDSAGDAVGAIILITNQWREEGNPDHQFDLDSLDDERTEGAFTGQEILPLNGSTEFYDLAGFWKDGEIQFTVNRNGDRVRYHGEFDQPNAKRLEFSSSAGDLVIVRD